jgi:hypothetical protein
MYEPMDDDAIVRLSNSTKKRVLHPASYYSGSPKLLNKLEELGATLAAAKEAYYAVADAYSAEWNKQKENQNAS